MVCLGRFSGGHVNGLQGSRNGGDGLHRRTHAQHVANAHTALNATCAVGGAGDAPLPIAHDFVVGGRAAADRSGKAIPDFHALDGLDAHEGSGQPRVQAPVPVHVAAQSGRQVVGQHLNNAAECFALLLGSVNLYDHGGRSCRVKAAQRICIKGGDVAEDRQC